MQTTWGDIPVRDAHVHFFSHGFFAALAREAGKPFDVLGKTLGWDMPDREPEALAARWVMELDRHGVASAVLIASVHGDASSVAAAVACFPHRFHGYFMLNPVAPDAMEHAQLALEQGLRGICLFPAMHRYSLHDERVQPVYEMAARVPGTVVFVHCGVLTVGARARLGLPSPFDMRFSNPIDLHAVALRHPDVNFVVPHFGAGYFREALMLCAMCPNVYLDTSSSNAWMRYLPEELDLARVLRRALDVAGPRRLLFGTDSSFFPRGWHSQVFDDQARLLAGLGLSADDAGLVFGGNLARLMDL
ncbi:MAG TPA: amidohydrolase family protein [Bryobacteraceae bacterium]|nr:amidohydrolase family protein [Bryobacteraceae bacterium]